MELNYLTILLKRLNKVYHEIRITRDYPYDFEDLQFLKLYHELNNLYETICFDEILDRTNQNLIDNYRNYSNDTHLVFDDTYANFHNHLKVAQLLRSAFSNPIIDYSQDNQTKLASLITKVAKEQMDYLNFKYQELFLAYATDKLVLLIQKRFEEVMQPSSSFADLIEFMCQFNNEAWKFMNNQKKTRVVDKKLKAFFQDLRSVFYQFHALLEVYFKLSIINNYNDKNIIKYSLSYIK